MTNAHGEKSALMRNDVDSSEIKLQATANKTTSSENMPVLDGNSIALALRIADSIQDETRKLWLFRRKGVILDGLKKLNKQNTYSFIGYMITTSKDQSPLGDIKKYVDYDSLKHMLFCFLKQAEDYGLNETFPFKKLKKEYMLILKECSTSPRRTVNRKIFEETNMFIENLYLEMCKSLY